MENDDRLRNAIAEIVADHEVVVVAAATSRFPTRSVDERHDIGEGVDHSIGSGLAEVAEVELVTLAELQVEDPINFDPIRLHVIQSGVVAIEAERVGTGAAEHRVVALAADEKRHCNVHRGSYHRRHCPRGTFR